MSGQDVFSLDKSPQSAAGEFIFPRFLLKQADGVFVDMAKLDSAEQFETLVDRIFSSGAYFSGLDYGRFQKLLYPEDAPAKPASEEAAQIRFAGDIVLFRPERQALYKGVRFLAEGAEYMFEPVSLEISVDDPVYEPGADGAPVLVRMDKRTVLEKTSLQFDEFVADMWMKGIRYGLDAPLVQGAISQGKVGRFIIARPLAPAPGKDAWIEEQTKSLHRDDTPRRLSDGRVDLCQFKNRFPQMQKGARLLKKIPRVLGTPGRELTGKPVEPPLPLDLDLEALAGPGTRVERVQGAEIIVAQEDGFLNIDTQTNQMSITEKIISREGISARTTGNLLLTGDEFEEFGEIQEKRQVEGKSITVHSDVFGSVISSGGIIHLMSNLMGGSALNENGPVRVDGLASNATLVSREDTIEVKRAENSTFVGREVVIESAASCVILADSVTLQQAMGCIIAARRVRLVEAGARNDSETVVVMLIPDATGFEEAARALEEDKAALQAKQAETKKAILATQNQPNLKNYLMLAGQLRRKELVLNPAQQEQWKKLGALAAPLLKTLQAQQAEAEAQQERLTEIETGLSNLARQKAAALAGITCAVESIHGGIIIQGQKVPATVEPLRDFPPKDLKTHLLGAGTRRDKLFVGDRGAFSWEYEAP